MNSSSISKFLLLVIFWSFYGCVLSSTSVLDSSSTNEVGLYPTLLELAVPTLKMNCSYIECLLNLFTQGYDEIKGLEFESCIKNKYDSKVAQLKSILSSGKCHNTTNTTKNTTLDTPQSDVRSGDNIIWAIDQNHAAWFRDPTSGQWSKTTTQQFGSNICIYIDRLPSSNGGYSWLIGLSSGPWWIKGTDTYWQRPVGFTWSFLYARINPFDESLWTITITNTLGYAKSNTVAFADVRQPSSVSKVKYLDLSPKDGSCYIVSNDYRVFYASGPNKAWTEITGLAVLNLRVIQNGYIFAIGTDKNAYYRTGNSGSWTQLKGEGSFTFLDVNNRGRIYAIKSDYSTYVREYISGTWINTNKALVTIRVMDDGAAYGVGNNDVSNGIGHIYVRNGTTSGTWTKIEENNGFNGAYSLWGPSNYRFYWAENNVVFDEKV